MLLDLDDYWPRIGPPLGDPVTLYLLAVPLSEKPLAHLVKKTEAGENWVCLDMSGVAYRLIGGELVQ